MIIAGGYKVNINSLSKEYKVRVLKEKDICDILNICNGNPNYYNYCPPKASEELIIHDMNALPPGKTHEDKYYIGFYETEKLVAIMDLIAKYPDVETAFIGFFMMNKNNQGKGTGTKIITECCDYLKEIGFEKVMLAYVRENEEAKAFWIKNKFVKTGAEVKTDDYVALVMKRDL